MRRLAPLLLALALLAGCGGDPEKAPAPETKEAFAGQSAAQILAAARRAALAAPHVTLKGDGQEDGQRVSIDVYYRGDAAAGNVDNSVGTLGLVRAGGVDYVKPNGGFFAKELGSRALEFESKLNYRWIPLAPSNKVVYLHRAAMLRSVLSIMGTLKKTPPRTLYGVECIGLTRAGTTLYVSTKDRRPVQVIDADGSVMNFEYGQHDAPAAPQPDEVADPQEFAGFGPLVAG